MRAVARLEPRLKQTPSRSTGHEMWIEGERWDWANKTCDDRRSSHIQCTRAADASQDCLCRPIAAKLTGLHPPFRIAAARSKSGGRCENVSIVVAVPARFQSSPAAGA